MTAYLLISAFLYAAIALGVLGLAKEDGKAIEPSDHVLIGILGGMAVWAVWLVVL